jgi:hypothetical protein
MKRRGQIYSVLQRRLDTNYSNRRRFSKADVVGDRSIKEVFHATDEFFDSIRIMAEDYKAFRKRFVKNAGERVIKDLLILKKTVTQNKAFLQYLIDNLPKPVGRNTITRTSILYQAAKFDEAEEMAKVLGIEIDDFFTRYHTKGKRKVTIQASKEELSVLKKVKKAPMVFYEGEKRVYFQNYDEFGEVAFSKDYELAGLKWKSRYIFHSTLIKDPQGLEITYDDESPRIGQIFSTIHGLAQITKVFKRPMSDRKNKLLSEKEKAEKKAKKTRATAEKKRIRIRDYQRQKAAEKKAKEKEATRLRLEAAREKKKTALQKKKDAKLAKIAAEKVVVDQTLLGIKNPETDEFMALKDIVKLRPKRARFGVGRIGK